MELDDFNWIRQRVTMTFSHLHNTWMLLLVLGKKIKLRKREQKKCKDKINTDFVREN